MVANFPTQHGSGRLSYTREKYRFSRLYFEWVNRICFLTNQQLFSTFNIIDFKWVIKSYIISGFPLAIAQVAGPNLAPRLRKHWTAPGFLQLIARSKGLIPLMSICSMLAPFSSKRLTYFKIDIELKHFYKPKLIRDYFFCLNDY